MFSHSAYTAWLDHRAGEIFEKITHQEPITNEETLVLILKAQSDQFRELAETMERRFEEVERRFELVERRFEQVERRFEQVDQRFEQMDKRFEQMDRRFEQLASNFKWGLIAAMGFLTLVIALARFVP